MKIRKPQPLLSIRKTLMKSSSSRSIDPDPLPPASTKEHIAEIIPQLFVADYNTVQSARVLEERGIQVIVNLIAHKCANSHTGRFIYENFEVSDTVNENLFKAIEGIMGVIEGHIKQGRGVVVHCSKGISRAPSVIIAYLIKVMGMEFESAFELVRLKSPRIDPNAGFMMQLSYLA